MRIDRRTLWQSWGKEKNKAKSGSRQNAAPQCYFISNLILHKNGIHLDFKANGVSTPIDNKFLFKPGQPRTKQQLRGCPSAGKLFV